jgi:hypothetical protein
MGKLLFTLLSLLLAGTTAVAVTCNSDGSPSSVQACLDSANDGDTITIPAGVFTWASGVTSQRGITLQGQGIGATIIRDNVQSGIMIAFTVPASTTARLTGIEFQDGGHGGRGNYANDPGLVNAQAPSQTNGAQFRFDHNKWNNVFGNVGINTVLGVADHNTFITDAQGAFTLYGSNWDGQPNGYDYSWHDPVNFGSAQFFFVEDNTFTNTNGTYMGFVTDAYRGARFVVRYNTMTGMAIGDHGTDSEGRTRGSRAFEIYNNTMNGNNVNSFIGGSRSSRVIIHDNNISGYWNNTNFALNAFRNHFPFSPFGGMTGTNPWDRNSPTIYFTGTAASASIGTTVTVSGNPNWTPNRWVGYVLRRLSDNCNSSSVNFGEIRSSKSNTLTYTSADYAANMSFCAGDSLEIRKVQQALDAPGRGQGSILSNVPTPTPPAGWNDQVTEPSYQWNNSPQIPLFVSSTGAVRAGEHFFNNTPIASYMPYCHPHPLVSGAPCNPSPTPTPTPCATPAAPSSLVANTFSSSEIDLTWVDNANNEVAFEVERANGGNGNSPQCGSFQLIATIGGANHTSYSDTNCLSNTWYCYRVRVVNACGVYSAYSNTASAKTDP